MKKENYQQIKNDLERQRVNWNDSSPVFTGFMTPANDQLQQMPSLLPNPDLSLDDRFMTAEEKE